MNSEKDRLKTAMLYAMLPSGSIGRQVLAASCRGNYGYNLISEMTDEGLIAEGRVTARHTRKTTRGYLRITGKGLLLLRDTACDVYPVLSCIEDGTRYSALPSSFGENAMDRFIRVQNVSGMFSLIGTGRETDARPLVMQLPEKDDKSRGTVQLRRTLMREAAGQTSPLLSSPVLYEAREAMRIYDRNTVEAESRINYSPHTHFLISPEYGYVVYHSFSDGIPWRYHSIRTDSIVCEELMRRMHVKGSGTGFLPALAFCSGLPEFRKCLALGRNLEASALTQSAVPGFPHPSLHLIPETSDGLTLLSEIVRHGTGTHSLMVKETMQGYEDEMNMTADATSDFESDGHLYCVGTDMDAARIYRFERSAMLNRNVPHHLLVRRWQLRYLEGSVRHAMVHEI